MRDMERDGKREVVKTEGGGRGIGSRRGIAEDRQVDCGATGPSSHGQQDRVVIRGCRPLLFLFSTSFSPHARGRRVGKWWRKTPIATKA